jgi:hypothetical protein
MRSHAAPILLVALLALVAGAGTATAAVPFRASIRHIDAATRTLMTGRSWHRGCPVGFADLRILTLTYWRFNGTPGRGHLVVNRQVAGRVVRIFRALYAIRFPIRRMLLVDAYRGSDYDSIEADNTSAFNCRAATGSTHWSQHAYGLAVDLDPIENPYVLDGRTDHKASRHYLRRRAGKGVILAGDPVVRAFARNGWGWGGSWSSPTDYQHFSATGT